MNISVYPGSKEIVNEANSIFGSHRVVEAGFREPVHINDLTEDELNFACEYFISVGKKVNIYP